jgi:membrane-associated phospholipid phosphatase
VAFFARFLRVSSCGNYADERNLWAGYWAGNTHRGRSNIGAHTMSDRTYLLRRSLAAALALAIGACSGDPTAAPLPDRELLAASGPTLSWNQTARELIASRAVVSPTTQIRILAYLTVAQYNAIVGAEDASGNASPAAAAAGASLVVLKFFFPLDSTLLDEKLRVQKASAPWPEQPIKDVAAGESIGRTVGAQVLAYAATDNTNLTTRPANPGGPGTWTGTNSARGFYESRTFALTSGSQFRPAPPPVFGSAEYNAALAEVRTFSDGLTAAQLTMSQDWAPRAAAYMNGVAAEMLVSEQRLDRDAARLLALANMAGFDVANACFDAKLAYYYIRPSQADPLIKLPIGLPNHPSYPSGHSCFTAAYATIIGNAFPEESERLTAMVEDAGNSRIYAGLHYRFDCTVGQELGRKVAQEVLRVSGTGRGAIPLD